MKTEAFGLTMHIRKYEAHGLNHELHISYIKRKTKISV